MYFLPLASFYISYMEKCGDIRLIDRLRIFMLFAILFCSLTLTAVSYTHLAAQRLKIVQALKVSVYQRELKQSIGMHLISVDD